MKSLIRNLSIAGLALAVALMAAPAWACPMCKTAAESDPRLPRAFMASILFMLAMPFTLLTCFGVGFYRLSKQAAKEAIADVQPDLQGPAAGPPSAT